MAVSQTVKPESPSSSIEQAQARLTQSLERLHASTVALAQHKAEQAEARLLDRTEALSKECEILKEENEKLNRLLQENINKYANLYKVTSHVSEKLEQTIYAVEHLLEEEATKA